MWGKILGCRKSTLGGRGAPRSLACDGNLPSGMKAEMGSKRVPPATTELNKFLNELIPLNLSSQMTLAFCWETYLNLLFPACPSNK